MQYIYKFTMKDVMQKYCLKIILIVISAFASNLIYGLPVFTTTYKPINQKQSYEQNQKKIINTNYERQHSSAQTTFLKVLKYFGCGLIVVTAIIAITFTTYAVTITTLINMATTGL
jgi:uncharacterized membrane protein YukC